MNLRAFTIFMPFRRLLLKCGGLRREESGADFILKGIQWRKEGKCRPE